MQNDSDSLSRAQRGRLMQPNVVRWMRPDAARWIRPDIARFLKAGADPADVFPALDRKYSPSQPRIPGGRTGGGRWTDGRGQGGGGLFAERQFEADGTQSTEGIEDAGGDNGSPDEDFFDAIGEEQITAGGLNDPRIISDADPEEIIAGEQYAQAGNRRGGASVRINGELVELSPAQAARLSAAQARAEEIIGRVREIEPNWKPPQSAYQSPEGLIRAYQADAAAAQARAGELAARGALPGPFAGDSIPALGPGRHISSQDRLELNRIGAETGCHTCGIRSSGMPSGNFFADHQIPTRVNPEGRAQRLYPQCQTCSSKQGPFVRDLQK